MLLNILSSTHNITFCFNFFKKIMNNLSVPVLAIILPISFYDRVKRNWECALWTIKILQSLTNSAINLKLYVPVILWVKSWAKNWVQFQVNRFNHFYYHQPYNPLLFYFIIVHHNSLQLVLDHHLQKQNQ